MGKQKKAQKQAAPSNKQEGIELEGIVTEARPNAFFLVSFDNGHTVLARIGGKLDKNHIRITVGDKVIVEVSPYDLTRGRITYRHKA